MAPKKCPRYESTTQQRGLQLNRNGKSQVFFSASSGVPLFQHRFFTMAELHTGGGGT